MKYNFTNLNIEAVGKDALKAATYFAKEIKKRTGKSLPVFEKAPAFPKMILKTDSVKSLSEESYHGIICVKIGK